MQAQPNPGPAVRKLFRFPHFAAFLMAWSVGAVDATTLQRFGVFTSNQAGNIALIAANAFAEPSANVLPALSLAGAAAGVTAGAWVQHAAARRDWPVVAPMLLGVGLVLAAAVLDFVGGPIKWLIPATSAGLASLAVAVLRLPVVGMWVTANTGQWLTAVSGLLGPRPAAGLWRGMAGNSRNAVVLISGFATGAAIAGSGWLPAPTVFFGVIPSFAALTLALVHRYRWDR